MKKLIEAALPLEKINAAAIPLALDDGLRSHKFLARDIILSLTA